MSIRNDVSRQAKRARRGTGKTIPFSLWFPLSVYALSRAIAAAYMIAASAPAHRSGYADMATAWDGGWYESIATQGYPSSLPVDITGAVEPSALPFSPLYALIVRALMAVSNLDFSLVAPTLSLILGAGAMMVIFVLMERAVDRFSACATVILTCTFMAAPVFQLAYAESLALLLLAGALLLLRERRYVAVAALIVLLALTRPVVIAFVPVVIAHGVSRWRGRAADPFPMKDCRAVALLAGWCIASTGLWALIVGVRTGDIFAWTKSFEPWQSTPKFSPGLGWPASLLYHSGWPALAMLVLLVLLTAGLGLRPGARSWGPELRSWSVAYPAYLLLVTVPAPSVIRWMLLAFPLMWPFPEMVATRSERRLQIVLITGLAIAGLSMQWVWVSSFLGAVAPSDHYP